MDEQLQQKSKSYNKMVIIIISVIIVTIITGGIFVLKNQFQLDCEELENRISKKLQSANFCDTDSDCIIRKGIGCPFGCGGYINKNFDMSDILKDYDSYQVCPDSKCEYVCELPSPPICVNNKCVASY